MTHKVSGVPRLDMEGGAPAGGRSAQFRYETKPQAGFVYLVISADKRATLEMSAVDTMKEAEESFEMHIENAVASSERLNYKLLRIEDSYDREIVDYYVKYLEGVGWRGAELVKSKKLVFRDMELDKLYSINVLMLRVPCSEEEVE